MKRSFENSMYVKALWMWVCLLSGTWILAQEAQLEGDESAILSAKYDFSDVVLDSIPNDTTRIRIGGLEIVIKDRDGDGEIDVYELSSEEKAKRKRNRRSRERWGMLEIGFNGYLYNGEVNLPSELNDFELNYGRSININLHLFRHRIGLIGNSFNFMYGLEFAWNNYRFENDVTLLHDVDVVTFEESSVGFKKNKLATTFLQIPVLFNVETNPQKPSKSFRISAGAYGGLLLSSRTKQKTTDNVKVKVKDNFNLNKFRYGVIGEIGLGCVNLYVDYALNGLFKEEAGPELRPFSVGLTLLPF